MRNVVFMQNLAGQSMNMNSFEKNSTWANAAHASSGFSGGSGGPPKLALASHDPTRGTHLNVSWAESLPQVTTKSMVSPAFTDTSSMAVSAFCARKIQFASGR